MFSSVYFWLSVLASFLLMFVGEVYVDIENGLPYSMFSMLFSGNAQNAIDRGDIVFKDIVLGNCPGYIWMFAPIITALPYVLLSCSGNTNSNTRFQLGRSGKIPYVIGRTLSGVFVGGIILLTGFLLYGLTAFIILYCVYTGQEDVGSNIYDMYMNAKAFGGFYRAAGFAGTLLLKSVSVFFYGCVSTFEVLFFASFIKNKYLVITTPFVLHYLWMTSSYRLLRQVMGEVREDTVLSGIYQALADPSNMSMLGTYSAIEIAVMLALNFLVLLLLFGIQYLSLERRCDCGES